MVQNGVHHDKPTPLNRAALKTLAAAGIEVPRYEPNTDKTCPTIVHISVGNFHRAHQALYLQDLLNLQAGEQNTPKEQQWREVGVGLLHYDIPLRDAMKKQECLYTLVERDAKTEKPKIIGSISEYIYAPDDSEAAIAAMASPACRIVSMTVTEGGYFVHEGTGEFDAQHPDIQHDLKTPDQPKTSFGYILAALRRRRAANEKPFTVLSCDNIQENGNNVKKMLCAFARAADAQLGEWLEKNGAFPNSMVDRITPATKDEHRELVKTKFGIIDMLPVTGEPFRQWVVEDNFPLGRPQWERVGVQVVPDVLPYELMKIRLLNGPHLVQSYTGLLLGHRHSPEAMGEKDIAKLTRRMMDEDTELLLPTPGEDFTKYKDKLIERFSNPAVNDQLIRFGLEGSARIPKFVLPCVRDALKKGSPLRYMSYLVASWLYLLGQDEDEKGQKIGYIDTILKDTLLPLAKSEGKNAKIMLLDKVFGDLGQQPRFADQVQEILSDFYSSGTRATLHKYANMA